MHHIHFDQIESTQNYLKDNWDDLIANHKDVLISANHQTKGIGRRGNSWKELSNALFLSISLDANDVLTLTSLEIGVHIVDYISKKFETELKLKWPNDILTIDGKKCGGILCHVVENKKIIVGIGLNLGSHDQSELPEQVTKFPISYINKDILLSIDENKLLAHELYNYVLKNRLNSKNTILNWNKYNYHQDHQVKITDGESIHTGIFDSIDEIGALNLKLRSGEIKKIYTGSLWEA